VAVTLVFAINAPAFAQNGPGDPVTPRASGLGAPSAVVADPYGDFIVSDRDSNHVWWVTTDGRKEIITREVPGPTGLGWDVFANLLIVGAHGVYKLNPQGKVSQMFADDYISDVALAPDGTLWFSSSFGSGLLRHYDAVGNLIEVKNAGISAGQSGPDQLAFSSSGELFYSAHGAAGGSTVYRMASNQSTVLFSVPWTVYDIAIDAGGNLYVVNANENHIDRYSAFGARLDNPFATVNTPTGIAFGRNADGSMNKRLFAVQHDGTLVELNAAGVQQPGGPVGFATTAQVIADLLKPGSALSDQQRHVLDAVGNRNGRFDVGDLRAFLIFNSTLSAAHAH